MKNILIALSLVIIGELHSGDFSEVFNIQEDVVIKKFKEVKKNGISSFHYLFGDWEREFKIGRELDHPAIIRAIDVGDHWLTLERAKGKPLCQFPKNSLTCQQAVDISLQLIDAIHYAFCHQYSNIEPQLRNVFISKELKVKIIDLAYFISFEDLNKHYDSENKVQAAWVRHFNTLSDVCMQVFDKVKLTREERIGIRLAIKQVAWNLIEDYEEKKEISFDEPFAYLRACFSRIGLRTSCSIPIE